MIRVHRWYLVFCIQEGTSSRHTISKINSTFQRQNHGKKWRRFGRNTDNSTMLTWPTTATTTKRPQTPKDQLSAPAAPSAVIFKLCTSFVQKICNASTEESTADETALSGRHPTNPTQPPPPPYGRPSNHTSPTPFLEGHTSPTLRSHHKSTENSFPEKKVLLKIMTT